MEMFLNSSLTPPQNDTSAGQKTKGAGHSWEFLLAALVTAVSLSLLIALLAKCQVVWRYLASYRHTRLREADTVSQGDPSVMDVEFARHDGHRINSHSAPPVSEEDDDGFIEDNYIPTSERVRAQQAAEIAEDSEDDIDEIVFTIA